MKLNYFRTICLIVLFFILSITSGYADVWDLKNDWSDTVNGGVWSYRHGNVLLSHVDGWNIWPNQPAWKGDEFVPVWFKSTNDRPTDEAVCDFTIGDIVTHSTDSFSGPNMGPSNVIWTSPINDIVNISGSAWAARDIGRSNHWAILLNGSTLTEGDVYSDDPYSRDNPFDFSQGSGCL